MHIIKKLQITTNLKNRNIYKSSVNSPISMYLKEKTEHIYQDPSTISTILPVKKGFETFFFTCVYGHVHFLYVAVLITLQCVIPL